MYKDKFSTIQLLRIALILWIVYFLGLAWFDWLVVFRESGMSLYYAIQAFNGFMILVLSQLSWKPQRLEKAILPLILVLMTLLPTLTIYISIRLMSDKFLLPPEGMAFRLMPILFMGVLLTAWRYQWRHVVIFCLGTAGLNLLGGLILLVTNFQPPAPPERLLYPPGYEVFVTLVVQTLSLLIVGYITSVLNSRLRAQQHSLAQANQEITTLNERLQAENLRLEAELDIAKELQQMILPKVEELQQIEGLDIAAYMEAADEVGGDYYDVLPHERGVKIGIGDVTGHGLESGVLMLQTQMGIRTLLTSDQHDPKRFFCMLNRAIYDNVQRMDTDRSLTLALLDYSRCPPSIPPVPSQTQDDITRGEVSSQEDSKQVCGELCISGQHEEVIVVRKDGQVELLDTIDLGIPIGLDEPIDEFIDSTTVGLAPGDGIVLYTDGITEAENSAQEMYGLERLCQMVSQHWGEPAEDICKTVINDVHSFIGQTKVFDDITLLVLKQKPYMPRS